MDRSTLAHGPVLATLVDRLRADERLPALAAALPTRVRVAEPALPLLLAALYPELRRGLTVLLPDDADARDAAEAIGWFIGDEHVALLPSRGVRIASGLPPPPALVGERAPALGVLAHGAIVCAPALAVAKGIPPQGARPVPLRLARGDEPGIDDLAAALVASGYERVERVEERGQLAVRGGLVDVFPTTGREPLRIELFGDEIESIRAFSPFTQRALRELEAATVYPAAERLAAADDEIVLPGEDDDEPARISSDRLVPPLDRPPDLVWQPDEVRGVWREEGCPELDLTGSSELDPFPQSQPFTFDAQRPALVARGLTEAENELSGLLRQGLDVVVAFSHRGEADRRRALLRRVEAEMLDPGEQPKGL